MSRMPLSLLLAALLMSTGCEDKFDIAQQAHTIEAYETYLASGQELGRMLPHGG